MSWITRIFGRTGDASPTGGAALMEEEGMAPSAPLTSASGPTATVPPLPAEPSITPAGDGTESAPVPESGIAPLVPEVNDEGLVGFGSGNEEGREYAAQVKTPEAQPTLEDVAPVHPSEQESGTDQLAAAFAGTVPTPPRPDFESDVVLAPPPGVVPPPLAPENPLAEAADPGQWDAGWPNKVDWVGLDTGGESTVAPMKAPEVEVGAGGDQDFGVKYTLFKQEGTVVRETENLDFKDASPSQQKSAEPDESADSKWTGPTLADDAAGGAEAPASPVARYHLENAWPSKLEEPPAAAEDPRWTGPTLSPGTDYPTATLPVPEATEPATGVDSSAAGRGVLRSLDGGKTWSAVEGSDHGSADLRSAPDEPAAGTAIGQGIGSYADDGDEEAAGKLPTQETPGLAPEARVGQPVAATGGAPPEPDAATRESAPSSLLDGDRDYESTTLADLKPSDSLTSLVNPAEADAGVETTEFDTGDDVDDVDL